MSAERTRDFIDKALSHWTGRMMLTEYSTPEFRAAVANIEPQIGMVAAMELIRIAAPQSVTALSFRETLRSEYADQIAKAYALLYASDAACVEMIGGRGRGDASQPYFFGLALLECFGERLDYIAAFRASRRSTSKRLGKSPWDIENPNDKDRPFLAKLRAAFPDKPWR